MNLQVGDRVIYKGDRGSGLKFRDEKPSEGRCGVVCNTEDGHYPPIGVEWDDAVSSGHKCDSRCKNGHGWYVFGKELQIIYEEDCDDVLFSVEDVL